MRVVLDTNILFSALISHVRRNGASFWLLNRAPEGVEERGYFAALAGVDLTLPAVVLGARYDAPSRTMQ